MKIYQIPEGIPNLQSIFPQLDFAEVLEWSVVAKDGNGEILGETRRNILGCCCTPDKVRIHFVNALGKIDAANFARSEKILEVKSDGWEKPLSFPLNRQQGSANRFNIISNESIEAETVCYAEKDQEWLAELVQSPKAWLEILLPNGFGTKTIKELVPIRITDAKFPIKKMDERFIYLVKIKFEMANSNKNFR